MNLNTIDPNSIKINGYTLNSVFPLEKGSDDVIVAFGTRINDNLPIVAKLSYQGLRLEREYHIIQRLYGLPGSDQLLNQPIEKINLFNGYMAIIFKYDGKNRLDTCQQNLSFNADHYSDTNPTINNNHHSYMGLDSFLDFAIQCCDCLEFIHKHQIVHGEIKLNAFLWPENNHVKLWNFGSGSRSLETNFTSKGWRKKVHQYGHHHFLQMLMYMSPEQTGRTTFQPDHRTDLYSIGITFYVVLTHTFPFAHNNPMEIVHNVMNRKLNPVHQLRSDLPMALSAIIEKLTNKSPDERYTSAHGLREDLKEIKRQLIATNDPQSISPFNLGTSDIASVFTLPNGCFGRKKEVEMVTNIVRKKAYMYGRNARHSKNKNQLDPILAPLNTSNTNSSNTGNNNNNNSTTMVIDGGVINLKNHNIHGRHHHRKSQQQQQQLNGWKSKPTEIVAIYGDSGVGKSTLVRNIQQVAREYGYIATAKFDTRQPTPYGCILRCLSIFFKNILGESQVEFDKFSSMLKTQLGSQATKELPTLLLDNVPEIHSFLDSSPSPLPPQSPYNTSDIHAMDMDRHHSNDIHGSEIKMRFHSVFLEIFQVMVKFKFVTLFLEDLHQADEASIELLDSLLAAKLDLLVIVTYRKDDNKNNMISTLLSNDTSVVNYVKLENMDQHELMDLVCTAMHRHKEIDLVLLKPLVDFISRKTKGNPFYACQLLTTLEKKGLIFFTWEQSKWEYNLQKIEMALFNEMGENSGGNLNIEFLVRRLKELPPDGQRFLKWAAFIGNHFNYETVRHLMMNDDENNNDIIQQQQRKKKENDNDKKKGKKEKDTKYILPRTSSLRYTQRHQQKQQEENLGKVKTCDTVNGLQSALQQGFIHAFSNDEFGFSHDRYSQAAMLLAKPEDRDKIHLKIATYFMDQPGVDIFWVADHIKAALHLIQLKKEEEEEEGEEKEDEKSKQHYRAILIRAGDHAYQSGAHNLAFSYYIAARNLLPNNPWRKTTSASTLDSNNDKDDSIYLETLHLYTQLAEISWSMGYDLTQSLLTTILNNAKTAIDRAPAYRLQHRFQWSHHQKHHHAQILLTCLNELGVKHLALDVSDHELQQSYQQTRKKVLKLGLNNILTLPLCESRLIRTRLSIMEELCIWGYWRNDIKSIMAVSLRLVMKTLQHSIISPSTGVGLVFYGMSAMLLYKDYDFGQMIGKIGVTICDQYGGNSECARAKHIYGAYLSIWQGHYREAIRLYQQALKQALLGGDRISVTYSHIRIASYMLFSGGLGEASSLSDTLREAKLCLDEVQGVHKTENVSIMATTIIRFILSLQGKTYRSSTQSLKGITASTTTTKEHIDENKNQRENNGDEEEEINIFDDDTFHESDYVADYKEKGDLMNVSDLLYWYYGMKLVSLLLFGYYKQASLIGHQYAPVIMKNPSFRHTHWCLFFYCLAMIRWVREEKEENCQKKYNEFLPLIMKYRGLLEEWGDHSKINLSMYVTLIDAELLSLSDENIRKTEQLYDLAISQAIEGNWQFETNVMYEYAGGYYMRNGSKHVAALLLEKAMTGYRHQGYYGKEKQLSRLLYPNATIPTKANMENNNEKEDEHDYYYNRPRSRSVHVQTDHVLTTSSATIPNRDSISDFSLTEQYLHTDIPNHETTPEETLLALDVVDLASILKSSRVISSEMNFELLMKQMLQIILENSGAESGVIIIKENSSFMIAGTGSQTDGCKILKTPKELSEEADSVVTRVARYAIHAQESLLIQDIQLDSRFSDCETIAKSVICTPIIHKSAIVGCIYIEGAVGSLTFRHEVVLRLLSQQVGISVTNALLFKSIQKVTYANVRMIENQKAALEEARRSKEAAERAMKLKADFLANMSHELRTPFSGFYGMISLLSETTLDGEQLDIVHTAKESCEMLLKIIDDLLNYSKLEAAKVTLDLGPLVVEEVIADTIEILSSLAARKGLELAYIVDSNVPKTIISDSSRLRQILTNLLGNAIKFTHHGGVVIKCHLVEDEKEKGTEDESKNQVHNGHNNNEDDVIRLKFEVIDTGIGIQEGQQRNLFEPFSQVDGSTTRMYGGTGLGLSICLQLVRLMGGTMDVESQINEGSNFWFTVMVQKVKKSDMVLENGKNLAISLSHHRLLLATSHDNTATMMKTLLPEFNVSRTSDTQHAVSQALQGQHQILLFDIPPKPNSFIAQQLQSVDDDPECELHIILLYAPATEGHKVAAEAINGASDRKGRTVKLAKPARRLKLLRILEQLLNPTRLSLLAIQQHHQQNNNNSHPSPLSALSRHPHHHRHASSSSTSTCSSTVTSPSTSTPMPHGTRISDYFSETELDYFKERNVLIAEDNMVAQKLLRKQLEKIGFKVESANNGEEAVELYQQRPSDHFSIGFFDHHMPKCDGVEATKRIRALESQSSYTHRLPIIALTADVQASAREICMNAKMDGYLTKPLITKELATTLRDLNFILQLQPSTSSTITEDDDEEDGSTLSNISTNNSMDSYISSNSLAHNGKEQKENDHNHHHNNAHDFKINENNKNVTSIPLSKKN
ncbi:hypothetical protein BJ944DRAFT_261543 [Cunninghamella echinulata]|nr:hypothetical protein BJ944DRAFT_261543 [Cunninghamella echinulata]